MPTIDINGASIAYTDTGAPADRPDAETIVFGHSLLFSGWLFRHQIEALRDRYRCVAIDWRGQGDSPVAATGYDMDTLTYDVVALIRTLGLGPVHWVGSSVGGFVGQRLAARHGALLRSVTLLSTTADAEDRLNALKYRLLTVLYRTFGPRPLFSQVAPIMFGRNVPCRPGVRSGGGGIPHQAGTLRPRGHR
jgi:3-oxoadipate enol-lactonase